MSDELLDPPLDPELPPCEPPELPLALEPPFAPEPPEPPFALDPPFPLEPAELSSSPPSLPHAMHTRHAATHTMSRFTMRRR